MGGGGGVRGGGGGSNDRKKDDAHMKVEKQRQNDPVFDLQPVL